MPTGNFSFLFLLRFARYWLIECTYSVSTANSFLGHGSRPIYGVPHRHKTGKQEFSFPVFSSIPNFCFPWPPNRKKTSFILKVSTFRLRCHHEIKFQIFCEPHPSPISIKLFLIPRSATKFTFLHPPDRPHLTFLCPPRKKERWCQKREGSPSLSLYWWMERGEASSFYSIFHTWRRKKRLFVFLRFR